MMLPCPVLPCRAGHVDFVDPEAALPGKVAAPTPTGKRHDVHLSTYVTAHKEHKLIRQHITSCTLHTLYERTARERHGTRAGLQVSPGAAAASCAPP